MVLAVKGVLFVAWGTALLMATGALGWREWCHLSCKKELNTMCAYPAWPTNPKVSNVTNTMRVLKKKALADAHNDFRNKLASGAAGWPPAADMRLLNWEQNLEKMAHRWALQGLNGHDKCRKTPDFSSVGQNVVTTATTGPKPNSTLNIFMTWIDEMAVTPQTLIPAYAHDAAYGHFTQLIWAASYKIGCAETKYNSEGFKFRKLVCDYAPAGNYLNKPMYTIGPPCSKCPPGTQCFKYSKYPFLCATLFDLEYLNWTT